MEFHVHTDTSLLVVGAMLSQNVIGKSDQPIMYVYRLMNKNIIIAPKKKTLVMVFFWHKFRHYFLGNKFIFYVNHMPLVSLVNKPHMDKS
jgi:hypothetical protein